MNIYFISFKIGNYFQLNCFIPMELSSIVVYKFCCPCDTAISYIRYTTRHLIARAHEHLNLNSIAKNAVEDNLKYFLWRLFVFCLFFLQYLGLLHICTFVASVTIGQTNNSLVNIIIISNC